MLRYLGILSISFLLACCSEKKDQSESIGFIDSMKLFESFTMKVEYDKILENDLLAETVALDSLSTLINSATNVQILTKLKREYQVAEQLMNNKFEQYSMKYTKLVTARLDEYVKEFAKDKNLDIVFSGNNGTVLFVKESNDFTEEMITYANKKFEE